MQRAAGVILLALGGLAAYAGLAMDSDVIFRVATLGMAAVYLAAAATNLVWSSGGMPLGMTAAGLGLLAGVLALAGGIVGSGTPDWGDLIAAIFLPIGLLLVLSNGAVLFLLRVSSRRSGGDGGT